MTIKNKINKIAVYALCCVFGLITVSCENFLNRPPVSQFDDDEFWQSEAQARAFMLQTYPVIFPGYGTGDLDPTTFFFAEVGTDNTMTGANQGELSPNVIPDTDGSWAFFNVRRANHIIANVHRIQDLDEAGIKHWEGIGRFFRAFFYSGLVFRFSDVPWLDRVPVVSDRQEDRAFLFKNSDHRTYVVARIMEDFEFAMEHVRANDGLLQINRYVVAAMASRLLLREGTFLRYVYNDDEKAVEVLQMARRASELVMSNPRFRLSDSYRALFNSNDLSGNPEIIMFRRYQEGVLMHSMLSTTTAFPTTGPSLGFAESFSFANGLPVHFDTYPALWRPQTAEAFFANRDPRLTMTLRPRYFVQGASGLGFVAFTSSGFSVQKFANDERFDVTLQEFQRGRNITDAPSLRLGEVLINYAEIMYELGELNQGVLDRTINVLRSRPDVNMPPLMLAGSMPMVGGVVYDDPVRLMLNPNDDVSPILWEIRRERRVELGFEGLRSADLFRWGKRCYLMNTVNPFIRYGAYIRFSDFEPNAQGIPSVHDGIRIQTSISSTGGLGDNADYHVGAERARLAAWLALPEAGRPPFVPSDVTSGFILGNWGIARQNMPTIRQYIHPVPNNQIILYRNNGFTLDQHPVWVD